MIDYGLKHIGAYGYNLVVFDNFSKGGFCVQLRKKAAQTITNIVSIFIHKSNFKPSVIETIDGKESVKKTFAEFSITNKTKKDTQTKDWFSLEFLIEQYVIYLKSHSHEKEMPIGLLNYQKYFRFILHSSEKFTPIPASTKSNVNQVFNNKRDKPKKGHKLN